ncbi:MAG: LysM peptidoglycan-binding domain-containing protein [Treponema sp.]|jgi:hypothetical protein|nr:LysM peptidoglycan-binding domain-containing protein [Treponema sp.]
MKRLFVFALLSVFVLGPSGIFAQGNDSDDLLYPDEFEDGMGLADYDGSEDDDIFEEHGGLAVYNETEDSDEPYDGMELPVPIVPETSDIIADIPVPAHIRNNYYFLESVRYTNMAEAAYEEGDYDASIRYSEEAVRYAQLSDEYVMQRLKINEADSAIAAAKERLDWASSSAVNAQTRFADDYNRARISYETAVNFRRSELWDNAINFAYDVVNILAYIDESGAGPLPAQYTVRAWAASGDCLWNIAGRPWAYGDPHQWRLLYEANRSKFPSSDNPNLIEPGMVLDIPSAKGETRQGMWNSANTYTPQR